MQDEDPNSKACGALCRITQLINGFEPRTWDCQDPPIDQFGLNGRLMFWAVGNNDGQKGLGYSLEGCTGEFVFYAAGSGESQNASEEGRNMIKERFWKVNTAAHTEMEVRRDGLERDKLFEIGASTRMVAVGIERKRKMSKKTQETGKGMKDNSTVPSPGAGGMPSTEEASVNNNS